MGLFGSKSKKEPAPPPPPKCDGCEKVVETKEELSAYIGKMYCKDCTKAIRGEPTVVMYSFAKQTIAEQLR